MGVVYAAIEETSGTMVALKLLRADAATPAARSRFERECRILSQFDHPHIARLLHHGITSSEIPFLVIEYVEGQPILDYVQSNASDLRGRLKLFRQLCLAVAVSHRRGVVHRDLKPANILVTADGEPKLLDFGIAKLAGDATERLTATGCRPMTPEYASIEQIRGATVTPASDVYSLGVILKELTESFSDERLSRVTDKATAERAEERYPSAAQLADDVTAYLSGKPLRARRRHRTSSTVTLVCSVVILSVMGFVYLPAERPARAPFQSERDPTVSRYQWGKLSPAELEEAEGWSRKFAKAEPASAPAHAGLADVLYSRGELGGLPPKIAFAEAKAAAEKSIRLDPRLALGHVMLANTMFAGEFRCADAESSFKKALELDPKSVRTLQGYGRFLMRNGRHVEARDMVRRARRLDPASSMLGVLQARISYYERDYRGAAQQLRTVIDREPGFLLAHQYLGLCHAYLGNVEQAESEMRASGLAGRALLRQSAWIRAINGDRSLADNLMRGRPHGPGLVFVAAQTGHIEAAFAMLEESFERRSPVILSLRIDPRFDPLRSDARFAALAARTCVLVDSLPK
jgi:serine/threonine protein kinase